MKSSMSHIQKFFRKHSDFFLSKEKKKLIVVTLLIELFLIFPSRCLRMIHKRRWISYQHWPSDDLLNWASLSTFRMLYWYSSIYNSEVITLPLHLTPHISPKQNNYSLAHRHFFSTDMIAASTMCIIPLEALIKGWVQCDHKRLEMISNCNLVPAICTIYVKNNNIYFQPPRTVVGKPPGGHWAWGSCRWILERSGVCSGVYSQ